MRIPIGIVGSVFIVVAADLLTEPEGLCPFLDEEEGIFLLGPFVERLESLGIDGGHDLALLGIPGIELIDLLLCNVVGSENPEILVEMPEDTDGPFHRDCPPIEKLLLRDSFPEHIIEGFRVRA